MKMRAALVGVEGMGGSSRYCAEIFKRIGHYKKVVQADITNISEAPYVGAGLNMPIQTTFRDYRKYDILHNLPAYPFYPIMRRQDAKIITTAHEFQLLLYPDINKAFIRTAKDRFYIDFIVRPGLRSLFASDYIVTNSIQTMEEAVKLGWSRKKIEVADFGVDERFIKSTPIMKKNKKAFKVGYLSTSSPRKNTFFAVRAFRLIKDQNFSFDIWGKNIYTQEETDAAIGNDKRIKMMGPAPEERIVDIYKSFDAFVFPTLYEGFGNTILEARAIGLPVVLYKNGHVSPEVKKYCYEAKDEEHMADIILKLKENGYNEKIKRMSMVHAKQFTWDKCVAKTVDIYKKLV